MYHHLLIEAPELAPRYGCTGVPPWQRRLLPLAFPLLRTFLKHRLGIGPPAAALAQARCQQVFAQVAQRIADGRPYLVGTRFSAADLTFASLCAPLLLTPGYGVPLPLVEEVPAAFKSAVTDFREHPAGRFALDLYVRHRAPAYGQQVTASGDPEQILSVPKA
jgi:glutathione S-transferase